MPRLKAAATIEQTKNTFDGENLSEIVNTAKNNVPAINPNCTELVRLARKLSSRLNCLMISGNMALPANHKEVQRNCETTIAGKIRFMLIATGVVTYP